MPRSNLTPQVLQHRATRVCYRRLTLFLHQLTNFWIVQQLIYAGQFAVKLSLRLHERQLSPCLGQPGNIELLAIQATPSPDCNLRANTVNSLRLSQLPGGTCETSQL